MSLQIKEWITYLVLLLLTFFVFWLIAPRNNYQPQGIALPITHTMAQKLMTSSGWNSQYTPTQWINIEYHIRKDSPAARKLVMQKAMQLAKTTGAKSVVMQPMFFADSTAESPMLSVLIAHGVAVK